MTSHATDGMLRPAVFLDRDGTINDDVGYLAELAHLTLYPWAIDAVRLLNRAGYLVVMVTNQGGIGRKMIRPEFLEVLHAAIDARLAAGGARVDGWYFCPHHPEALIEELRAVCDCRKPATGLVRSAARDLGIDLARSWIVGDKWSDIQAGQRTGGRGILVRTGWGVIEEGVRPDGQTVEAICDTLAGAVSHILTADGGGPAAAAPAGR
jgi:D-glycero-D-manno-heptose 1,7-bisphosphate phosphatase